MRSVIGFSEKSFGLALLGAMTVFAGDADVMNQRARTALKEARATDSASSLTEAEDSVRKGLQLSPENFEARKIEVKVLLARHRFSQALEQARAINKSAPDDVEAWGLVSDAALALGDYTEAEHAAQWMLNLRSTNVGGLERGARLRELFGDHDGAQQFWQSAMRLTLADEEQRAWLATQMASLSRRTGHAGQAEGLLSQVLEAVPGYQPALAEMARVKMQQRRYGDAVTLLRARYQKVARPDVQFELARALQMAGQDAEAQTAYGEFERAALAVVDAPYNYNRELVVYYADHAGKPADALRVAKAEAARRQDVETLDAYAWALAANGNLPEARQQMEKALAVGLRDASFFYHAGAIAAKLKDATAAAHYFNESLAVSAEADTADAARGALKGANPHAD